MALSTAYMTSVKNIPAIFDSIKGAAVPPKFTNEFLKSLGFLSSNDRAFINVLKGIGFLDPQGVPTELYRQFRDSTQSGSVLANAMRDSYSDLFLAHLRADELPAEKLKGFFATKTDKGDRVVELMAGTFRALVRQADFKAVQKQPIVQKPPAIDETEGATKVIEREGAVPTPAWDADFHYNIQIHLPATRDISVYNAIFKSLRDNLS